MVRYQSVDTNNVALKTLGLRGVICAGWSDVEDSEIPDHICLIKEAPHDWLFPKCKAIVHHGGAGTTGSAVLAGKPMVVFPVIADQTWWASLAASRGVSPTTIVPFPKLTEETLVNGLTFAIQDEPVRKARELGEKVRAEQNGADFIADYMVTAIENGTAYIPHVGKQRSSLLRVVVATSIVVAASVGALYVYKEHKAQNVRYGLIDGTIAAVRGTLR
jgi:UDP:flavonoid glycosyltransferase YjiC (YdhE family)